MSKHRSYNKSRKTTRKTLKNRKKRTTKLTKRKKSIKYCKHCGCWHKNTRRKKQRAGDSNDTNSKINKFIDIITHWYKDLQNKISKKLDSAGYVDKKIFENLSNDIYELQTNLSEYETMSRTKLNEYPNVSNRNLATHFIKLIEPLDDLLAIKDVDSRAIPKLKEIVYNEFWPERMNVYKGTRVEPKY